MAAPSGRTTRRSLPYPLPDEYVDGGRDFLALANALDGDAVSAATIVDRSGVVGEARDRWQRQADGSMLWGPGGAAAPDTRLGRVSSGVLGIYGAADTQPRWQVGGVGMSFGPGGAAAADVNLYRAAADVLQTDDALVVGGGLYRNLGGNYQVPGSIQQYTRMAFGTVQVGSGTSAVANTGLGVTAQAAMFCGYAYGLPPGNSSWLSYDIPNTSQIRVYNPGSGFTLTLAFMVWG